MDEQLRAKIKAWPGCYKATMAMLRATEAGDLLKTKALLSLFPLLDFMGDWMPYNAKCWSQIAAATGQLELMNFWRQREKKNGMPRLQATPELLLLWAMGEEILKLWSPSIPEIFREAHGIAHTTNSPMLNFPIGGRRMRQTRCGSLTSMAEPAKRNRTRFSRDSKR